MISTFHISTRAIVGAITAILLSGAGPAAAATLNFTTNAESNTISGIQSDPQGPASSGSLTSSVTAGASDIEFSGGPAYATAAADASGHSAVVVDGNFPNGNTFNSLTSTASFTQQFTNMTGASQSFLYDFSIFGPTLTLSDYAGHGLNSPYPLSAYYSVEITVDHGAGAVTVWDSLGTLTGGRISYSLSTSGSNPFTGTLFGSGTNTFGYNFTGANGSISDIALAGETVTITSTLIAGMNGPGYEVGGRATIGDPNNLSLGNGFSGNLTTVPIPASAWLLVSGLLSLIGFTRRLPSSKRK